jgi:hypothetical protein
MRLINGLSYKLEEFTDDELPTYAILSHTWGVEEVSFQDICNGNGSFELFRDREGYKKIKFCCQQAWSEGIRYSWVDTCCIDKTSSAELSEAINSMFRWYKRATVCYALLTDVHEVLDELKLLDSPLRASRWFTRGWTLQELIAPEKVLFFNANREHIGSKRTLRQLISSITGIDVHILQNPDDVFSINLARRMSWAANRNTTRLEDIAYCLMGIFDVNMPLLYGEGEKAFLRLQEEIIKDSDDQSLFAWEIEEKNLGRPWELSPWDTIGIFASHPSMFRNSDLIETFPAQGTVMTMTNRGLQVQLPILRLADGNFAGILSCSAGQKDEVWENLPSNMAIPLANSPYGNGSLGRQAGYQLLRVREAEIADAQVQIVYLAKNIPTFSPAQPPRPYTMKIIDNHCSCYAPRRAIYAAKPLSSLTTFKSWALPIQDFRFPPDRADYMAAFHFTHVVDARLGFVVVLESRRVRQLWSMLLFEYAKDESLEDLLVRSVGSFRNNPVFNLTTPDVEVQISSMSYPDKKGIWAGFQVTILRGVLQYAPRPQHELAIDGTCG